MDQPDSGGQTPPQSPPPQQSWQSTPQPPAPPPPTGGQPGGGMPSWTSNLTAQGTVPGPGGVALADTPNRVIAAVIDFIILGIVGFIVSSLTTSMLGESFGGLFRIPSLISSLAAVVIMLAVSGAYFIGMWTRMGGATVGMRVLKLTVRDASSGGPITQQQAISRWLLLGAPWALAWFQYSILGLVLSVAVLVWYIYLLVTVAQSATRQGLHDKQGNTVVAKG